MISINVYRIAASLINSRHLKENLVVRRLERQEKWCRSRQPAVGGTNPGPSCQNSTGPCQAAGLFDITRSAALTPNDRPANSLPVLKSISMNAAPRMWQAVAATGRSAQRQSSRICRYAQCRSPLSQRRDVPSFRRNASSTTPNGGPQQSQSPSASMEQARQYYSNRNTTIGYGAVSNSWQL